MASAGATFLWGNLDTSMAVVTYCGSFRITRERPFSRHGSVPRWRGLESSGRNLRLRLNRTGKFRALRALSAGHYASVRPDKGPSHPGGRRDDAEAVEAVRRGDCRASTKNARRTPDEIECIPRA